MIVSIFLIVALRLLASGHVHHKRSSVSHFSHMQTNNPHQHQGFTPIPKVPEHKEDCICVLPVQCPAHVVHGAHKTCKPSIGRSGVCCNSGQNHTDISQKKLRGHHFVRLDHSTLNSITRHSRIEIAELRMREARILSSRSATVPVGSASYGHFRNSRMYSVNELSEVMGVANRALEIALATRAFKDRQGLSNQQLEWGMIEQDLRPTSLGAACLQPPVCSLVPERYQRIDGACNNMINSAWGAPMTPYSRLLPPSYQDGIWTPRVSEDQGQPLPSPRAISAALIFENDKPLSNYTLLLMQFGQFISHEMTQSIDTSYANGSAVSCCTEDGSAELPTQFRHFACMPILISPQDSFYSAYKQGCMNFVRSVLAPRHDCTLGFAQQMNKVTHFIDGSSVYGSTLEQVGDLRSFKGGRLRVFRDFGRDLMPLTKDPEACLTMEQGSACFSSGDTRTNQMVSLVVLHTLFFREHNRLVDELAQLNPHWNDETLFVEARRILVAEMQVVTYKEYLPIIVGEAAIAEFDLGIGEDGYYYDYDQRVEPSVTNEFAAAAFRFGHSMVDGVLKVYSMTKMEEAIAIPEIMFFPARMRQTNFLDEFLNTLTSEPIQDVDTSLTDALTKYMFRAGNPFGVDLASFNIQRGRDHGLRPYNDYRELVGLERIKSFQQFGELGEKLQRIYASVDDVDLWVGGLVEPKVDGAMVGLTFRDIVADQFFRLKKGDRYFFNHDPTINPGYFSPEQLQELRKVSMARIICDNSDGILLARQAPNAFRKPGVPGNEYYDCSSPVIPHINLIHWQEV